MAAPANGRTGVSTHSPQLMTDVDGVFQYGVVIREDWGVTVFKRTKATGATTTYDISADTTARTALGLYLQNGVYGIRSNDDHYALALGVDDQNRVWLAGNAHGNELRLIRSAAADITSWTQQAGNTFDSLGARKFTYFTFARLSTDQLLVFFNQDDSTTTSQGRDYIAMKLGLGGNTWSAVVGDGHFATTENLAGVADRVYVLGVKVDRNDRVHVAGIWRDDDANADSQKRPWYVYSDDLTSWYAVDGTLMSMPLTWTNFAAAEITSAPAFSRNYGQGIALDPDGYPSVIVQNGNTDQSYVRLYWDGTDWQSTYLTSDGTAGGTPIAGSANGPNVHDIRNRLYLMTQGSSRVRVRELDSGAVLYLGPADSGFEPNPDPIALLDGSLEVCVPDGDTPRVFTFGNHARAFAS